MINEQFFVFRDRSPISPDCVRKVIRTSITSLGLDASLYDTHSLCIGRTTDMVQLGYPIETVKLLSRWKSNCVYKYIR